MRCCFLLFLFSIFCKCRNWSLSQLGLTTSLQPTNLRLRRNFSGIKIGFTTAVQLHAMAIILSVPPRQIGLLSRKRLTQFSESQLKSSELKNLGDPITLITICETRTNYQPQLDWRSIENDCLYFGGEVIEALWLGQCFPQSPGFENTNFLK